MIVGESVRGMNMLDPREDVEAEERFMAECISEELLVKIEVGGEVALREEEKKVGEVSRKFDNPIMPCRRMVVV